MKSARSFLVICGETDRLFLLSGVLHRVFPNSVVQTCRDADAALEVARSQRFDAIVSGRPSEGDALALVRNLAAASTSPIVVVADPGEQAVALAAGATRFLDQEEWLLIGKTVAAQIGAAAK